MVDLPVRLLPSKARLNAKGRGWRNGSRDLFAGTAVLIDPESLASAAGLAKKLADLFEPMAYQGASQALIDRLPASFDT